MGTHRDMGTRVWGQTDMRWTGEMERWRGTWGDMGTDGHEIDVGTWGTSEVGMCHGDMGTHRDVGTDGHGGDMRDGDGTWGHGDRWGQMDMGGHIGT